MKLHSATARQREKAGQLGGGTQTPKTQEGVKTEGR